MKTITKTIGYIGLSVALWHVPHGQAITLQELNKTLTQWHEKSVSNLREFLKDTTCWQKEAQMLLEKYQQNLDVCTGEKPKTMHIETFGFPSASLPETPFSRYQKEKWETWRKNKKGNPLDIFSQKLSEDELRKRYINIEEVKKLGILSVREITFDSILESDFFNDDQRKLANTWLNNKQALQQAIETYVTRCTFWDRDFFEELTITNISFENTISHPVEYIPYPFLKPANEGAVVGLRQKTERGLKNMLSRKNGKEKVILFLLLENNTPENARAKWRYHSDKNKRLGRYNSKDNLFSFIGDVDGIKALSHEIGHFLQEHLGFRQTFEDYGTQFAKNLLLLENDYTENDIFNMPECIQNVLGRFYDHKNIETETKYTPNLKQLSKKTCFEYFQLTARWRKSCEISNILGVYFKGNTLYINTLSDFPEYNVIFYGHEYKINEESVKKIRSELEDEKTKKAFSDILGTTYKKSVPKDMLNLLGHLHKHEKYEKIMCPFDYQNRDGLKEELDLYGDF